MVIPPRLTDEPSLRTTTTDLIETAESGDDNALNQLIPIVYEELRILAHRQLAHEQRHDSLQTTALVHEVYLRLARVVALRFFAGPSVTQTAEVLGASPRTVKSDWAMARAWLFSELGSHDLTGLSDKT